MTNPSKIQLIYDGECPACNHYVHVVRIRESLGELELLNARENPSVMAEINAAGLDIDQGMVLKADGQLYYGADAVHALALMGTGSDAFNRLNYWMFRSSTVAAVLYPVLRAGRNLLLKLRGVKNINNLGLSQKETF